jgi:hypothetical protein
MNADRLVLANDHMKIGGDHRYAELLIMLDIAHSLRALYEHFANGGDVPR